MSYQNQNNEIEIEQFEHHQNQQMNIEYSQGAQGHINSGFMQNEDSSQPQMSTNHISNQNFQFSDELEQELCDKNNFNSNKLTYNKLKNIQEVQCKNKNNNHFIQSTKFSKNLVEYDKNNLSNSQTLSNSNQFEQNSQQWRNYELQLRKKNSKQKQLQSQNESEQGYKQSRIQTQPITHILVKELDCNQIFYVIGNLIFDFKSRVYFDQNIYPSELSQFDDDNQRVVSNAIKSIVSIENSHQRNEITAKLQLNVKPLAQFDFVQRLLNEKSNTQLSKQIAVLLDQYQNNAANSQRQNMLRAIQRAEECKMDFIELMKERKRLLNELQKKVIEENDHRNTSFYVASHYCADYESLEYNLQEFSYSYPLVALLGFEPAQFATGILKKGLQMWVSPHTRALLLTSLLYELATLGDKNKEYIVQVIEPFYFKTVDLMTVSCRGKREKYVLKYEGIMEYIFEDVYDSIQLLTLDVDLFTIKRILGMRKDYVLQQQASYFIEDFEYNIQSQIFLEKYYNDIYQNYIQEQQKIQKINEKKAQDDTKVCSYKVINQQEPVTSI